ncbi:MAG: nucleotidyltransferase family protein [Planctomycetota bacterium]
MSGGRTQGGATKFTALVLAGQRGGQDPVAQAAGVSHKCLVPAAGVPMLRRVVDALAASPSVGPIAVSIEQPALLADWQVPDPPDGQLLALASAGSPSQSVLAAVEALGVPYPLLITTADHPLLSLTMIETFCAGARRPGIDVAVGLTAREVIAQAYPDNRRTYIKFRDTGYSGANLFAIVSEEGLEAVRFWRRVERERKRPWQRKRPWRMVRAFGWGNLLDYRLVRLTLDQAMERASRVLGLHALAVALPFAEAAIDVDKPADLKLVEEILAQREAENVPARPSV